MSNTYGIFSENGSGQFRLNDAGLSSQIDMVVGLTGDTIDTSYSQKSAQLTLSVRDNSIDKNYVSIGGEVLFIETQESVVGTTGKTENAVQMNSYKYATATLTTTDNTTTEIIKLTTSELFFNAIDVKVWCSAYDTTLITSGLTQEFTSGYLLDGTATLQELSLGGPTTNLNYSTFDGSVTADLTYNTSPAAVIVNVTGLPTTSVTWKCRARWTV
jgi:hypothetical protein